MHCVTIVITVVMCSLFSLL